MITDESNSQDGESSSQEGDIEESRPGVQLKILVVRPDRLGDVILSTPVFEVIKRHYPKSNLTVLIQENIAPIIRGLPSVDNVMIYEPSRRHAGIKGFFRLASDLRKGNFRIAVVLQSNWRIGFAVLLSRIRYRLGPLSKFHSYFVYNRGIRQHRSHVEMHETDYNLQLLRRLGIRVATRTIPTTIKLSEQSREEMGKWLREQGWDGTAPIIGVHPGMGGSALNWPEANYIDLIRTLIQDGRKVLVSAGPLEGAIIERIQLGLGPLKDKAIYFGGADTAGIDRLAGLYSWFSLVIAPSTGPLHLAVALGKPVVTFYPPIRVQSALRWGPYIPDLDRASILVPEIYCGEDFKCRGSLCNYFPCMKGLTVAQTLEQIDYQLSKAGSKE
jgi:ADP-heptose:LPS heptosyltransferase